MTEHALDCVIWTGAKSGRYGSRRVAGRTMLAHRFAYEQAYGPIPEGLEIDHLCRNTLCVEPTHLEAVTPTENRRRQGAARTHCIRGHAYDEANTGPNKQPDGYVTRRCRTCHRDSERERNRERRAS